MQIRGRHRGLPYALDKAILLPSEGLQKKEEEEVQMRTQRRNSARPSSIFNEANDGISQVGTSASNNGGTRKKARRGWSTLIAQALQAGPAIKKMMVD